MQELRLVAVSEDGSYAILALPGRSNRFLLPIDDRLRTVAKGQFSRLAQYEIEVENPLRPKEIQDRIRAGETAEEIADAAGIPPDRIRRFEGPILAERQYQAEQAQRATIRAHGESGPGPRLGDIVAQRLSGPGAHAESTEWDSRKRPDGNWQVQLQFIVGGRMAVAEWIYDPRRRHVIPDDEQAIRLCLPPDEWAAINVAERNRATATVTPIGSRQHVSYPDRDFDRRGGLTGSRGRDASFTTGAAAEASADTTTDLASPAAEPGTAAASAAAASGTADGAPTTAAQTQAGRTKKSGRPRRASVPSWDEIMFGTSRQSD
jgi:hypothetical protein